MTNGRLERYLRALPRSLRPAHDLWPGITKAMHGRERSNAVEGRIVRRRRLVVLAAAAGALAVAAVAVIVALPRQPVDGQAALVAKVRDAEKRYEAARRDLQKSLQALGARYGAASVAGFEEDVAAADRQLAELRAAVERAPGGMDGQALTYQLAGLYRSQADMLERTDALVLTVSH